MYMYMDIYVCIYVYVYMYTFSGVMLKPRLPSAFLAKSNETIHRYIDTYIRICVYVCRYKHLFGRYVEAEVPQRLLVQFKRDGSPAHVS